MMGRCFSSIPSSNPSELNKFQTITGLQHLAEARRFKAWFLDQFGVLHDGKQPYPGFTDPKDLSVGLQFVSMRDDPWFAGLGRSCIHMTWSDRGAISLEGLGLQVVDNVEEAEFVLAHGTEALGLSSGDALPMKLEELDKILGQCADKKIPMVVANPDFVTVEARALRVMPGTLAATYEKLGGEVKWMGKPGESPVITNSKGANIAGISSAFVTCGIHANELGLDKFGETADDSSVSSLATKYDAYPTYVLPSFTW
ncbi:hypothetical protein DH2020_028463 [Rehmannia glutinosa]|uniref:Uncharacterized protein n=1 Tax=Rehmannia glutinosa TaxID=99300 RepID=A0ABR0VU15_REHGL